ncbi:MAG: hypothetical protein PHR36_03265 [Patescibacteria group bacterium]|nr:hypothetical protein [Patescibacteria group bacterium]
MEPEKSLSREEWLQILREVYEKFPDWDKVPKIWRVLAHNRRVVVKSFGFCHWQKVIFLWRNGREFYRLERNLGNCPGKADGEIPREEYFRGQLVREYVGQQNCFVEFCEQLWKHRRPPSKEKFSQVESSLGLDRATAKNYISFYRQCFCPPKRKKRTRTTGNL